MRFTTSYGISNRRLIDQAFFAAVKNGKRQETIAHMTGRIIFRPAD